MLCLHELGQLILHAPHPRPRTAYAAECDPIPVLVRLPGHEELIEVGRAVLTVKGLVLECDLAEGDILLSMATRIHAAHEVLAKAAERRAL